MPKREGEKLLQSLCNVMAVEDFRTDPIAIVFLRGLERRSSSTEWIKHDVADIGRHQNGTFWNDEFKFVNTRANFEFAMPVG